MSTAYEQMLVIEHLMAPILDGMQARHLHSVLVSCLLDEKAETNCCKAKSDDDLLNEFIAAKRLEGCSERTLKYYECTLRGFMKDINKAAVSVRTEDVRLYLSDYQTRSKAGSVTLDNIRRIISSFYSWLETESYVCKSPMRRIKKIKTPQPIRPVYSDEMLEVLRDGCTCSRDLAIVDLLTSTGVRIGELVRLNRDDISMDARECVVHGKGNKQRRVYFDARTKVHLQRYLEQRKDNDKALFVSLDAPHERLSIGGIEMRLRKLGRDLDLPRVHPHKFRRTLATRAIDKGMPIEQVQVLLGHSKIDTTLCYAMVDEENVRRSHKKYIA